MAAVSALPSSRGLSPPYRQQDRDGDEWDLGIPADPKVTSTNPAKSPSVTSQFPYQRYDFTSPNQHELSPQSTDPAQLDEMPQHVANGTASLKSPRSHNVDPQYLSPFKPASRPGVSDSRSGSEPDSLIDLYGHPRSVAAKSIGENSDKTDRSDHRPMDHKYIEDDEDPERSRWIHRDKLALIESKEMEEAGIIPPLQPPRSTSRPKSRREPSQELYTNGPTEHETEVGSAEESKKSRTRSPERQEQQQQDTLFEEFDLRTPEEIAADSYLERTASPMYRQQGYRFNSSRIPLPRSSPLPIPQEHIERNTPLTRKRGASSGDEDTILYSHVHSRNNSIGSHTLLDDPELPRSPTAQYGPNSRPTSQDSPSKIRTPSNRTPQTGKPSTSTPNSTCQKPRSTSTTARSPSTPIRPKSRSGLEPRPPTAINRPEGDPPWLATMYKPDPRLPPDQQILPTHAKRLQQEQWEKAGKENGVRQAQSAANGRIEDEKMEQGEGGRFSPLAMHTRNGLQAPNILNTASQERQLQDKERERRRASGTEWPLTKAGPKASTGIAQLSLGRESERGPEDSTMPKGLDMISKGDVPASGNTGRENPTDPIGKERLARQEADEKAKRSKEKGCACCVVM
ncbi:MAG: hypothetical protein Q9217_005021 [Psora testacea]